MNIWRSTTACLVASSLLASSPVLAEDVLRIGTGSDLQIVDPVFTSAHQSRDHGYLVYDTLFGLDADGNIQPQMLEGYAVSDDSASITLTLREGLKFHDGAPVTGADVVASIQRWGQADSMAQLAMETVDKVEATDEKTVKISLKKPTTIIIDAMAKPSGQVLFIMPERIAAMPVDQQIEEVVGSGPFTFDRAEWVPGQQRIYRKNENYVPRSEPSSNLAGSREAKVDTVSFSILPDDATRQAALIAGEIDYIPDISADLLPIFETEANISTGARDPQGEQIWMRFNHLQPPFDDQKVRQAVYWAVDQTEYMQAIIGNPDLYKVCGSLWGCGGTYSTDAGNEAYVSKDIDKAKELLAGSSYDGRAVVILDPTDYAPLHNSSLQTAQVLREIGMQVELRAIPVKNLSQIRTNQGPVSEGGWNIFHTTFPVIDVSDPIRNPAVNSKCDRTNWPGWPCSEEIEAARDAFFNGKTLEERKKLAAKVQELAFMHGTHIPVGTFFKVAAWRNVLDGVRPTSVPAYWGIAKTGE